MKEIQIYCCWFWKETFENCLETERKEFSKFKKRDNEMIKKKKFRKIIKLELFGVSF